MYYYQLQPPYLLLVFGLFAALTSGLALAGTLKLIAAKWQNKGTENSDYQLLKSQLTLPFLGITGGVGFFLCSGFEIFGFPPLLSYGVGVPLAIVTCLFVWLQLRSMLVYAEERGIESLDLDSWR
ncbi:hypothetical protein [Chlorogloeopsis sp. ULAP02]|uniref:hypothetical protein n=1 Tax=Chlorogloeopsis sp. ULAP02 TaxID=3107926 RepID=UPI003135D0CC